MVISYSTNAFVKKTLSEAVDIIADIGFKGVEIMCDKPHLYPPDSDIPMLLKLKRKLDELNLKITNLNCFTLFALGNTYLPSWIEESASRRQDRIDHTLNCIKIAYNLGCKNISIPPGGPLNNGDRKRALSLFHEGLDKVAPLAQQLDITLLIEPEPGLLIENTNQIKSFLKETASDHIGINFDAGHFYCVNEKPEDAFETLFEKIGHIHIEDIAASREHVHLIPGVGAMDFHSFFDKLRQMRYQGDVCVELYPYTDIPGEAGIKSLEFLSPIIDKYRFDL